MSSLHCLAAIVPLLTGAGADDASVLVLQEAPKRYVVVERPGKPPVVVMGSERVLARDDLVGTWQVVHLEHEAELLPHVAATLQMKFTRGRLELMQQGRRTTIVAYDLTTTNYPRDFEWSKWVGGRICLQKGVYWLEGDTLMLCLGAVGERKAAEFLTQPNDGRTLFVLERAQP